MVKGMNELLINGTAYKVVESSATGPFQRMASVGPGEACACYADNQSNNWGV